MCLLTLFDICKYKTDDEIIKDCNNNQTAYIKEIIQVKKKYQKYVLLYY